MYPEKPLSSYHAEQDPPNLSRMQISTEVRLKRPVSSVDWGNRNMRTHLVFAVNREGACQSARDQRRQQSRGSLSHYFA